MLLRFDDKSGHLGKQYFRCAGFADCFVKIKGNLAGVIFKKGEPHAEFGHRILLSGANKISPLNDEEDFYVL